VTIGTATTRRIGIGPAELEIDDSGRGGIPVVLVHGWLGSRQTWSGMRPALERRHRVVSLDLRGHGASSAPDAGYTALDMAGDVAGLIRELALGPSVVLAHSMGASVATRLAIAEPGLVSALVLVDPDYGGDPAHRADLAALIRDADDETVKARVVHLFRTRIDAATRSAALRELHLAGVLATRARVVAQTLRANLDPATSIRFRPEAEAVLPRRTQPVLSLHRLAARAAWESGQATHPSSAAVVVPSAGHWIHEERPDLLVERMEAWVDALTPRTGAR
jgi:pimeloyl-ACP methyl ester carboxylesterase